MLFSNLLGTWSKLDYMLDNKYVSTNLKWLNNVDQNEIKLKINNKKGTRESPYIWKIRKYTSQRRNHNRS